MIKDDLNRADVYFNISPKIKAAFEWLRTNDIKNLPDGRYEISDKMYANIQSYFTKENALYEAHRNYIDIQYMINGEEVAGVTDYANCTTLEEYDKNKDIEFLKCNSDEEFYKIKENEFFIFFPHDAHKPSLKVFNISPVKKVVVKVDI